MNLSGASVGHLYQLQNAAGADARAAEIERRGRDGKTREGPGQTSQHGRRHQQLGSTAVSSLRQVLCRNGTLKMEAMHSHEARLAASARGAASLLSISRRSPVITIGWGAGAEDGESPALLSRSPRRSDPAVRTSQVSGKSQKLSLMPSALRIRTSGRSSRANSTSTPATANSNIIFFLCA